MAKILYAALLVTVSAIAIVQTAKNAPEANAAQPATSAAPAPSVPSFKTQQCATVNGATVCVWK